MRENDVNVTIRARDGINFKMSHKVFDALRPAFANNSSTSSCRTFYTKLERRVCTRYICRIHHHAQREVAASGHWFSVLQHDHARYAVLSIAICGQSQPVAFGATRHARSFLSAWLMYRLRNTPSEALFRDPNPGSLLLSIHT